MTATTELSTADQRIASRQDRYEAWLTAAEAAECRRVLGVTLSSERKRPCRSASLKGSHRLPDGSCCHCGPANVYTGPQWVCECRS